MIRIQNVYYMLAYAFKVLNEQGYKDIATESFENTAELFAAILAKGVSVLLKRGLGKEYISRSEPTASLRGKLELSESIKTQTALKKQMVCSYDEFSENSVMNRIIKATAQLLIKADISKARKKALRKLMVYFINVEDIDLHNVDWYLRYDRNNQTYRMLISICYLTVKGLLQTNSNGCTKLMDFLDEQRMSRLYEKFILEYYRKEYPQISVSPSQIPWALDDEQSAMLPAMQSDITLTCGERVLIIDAKYYSHATQVQYDVHTQHSGNVYQIFTYVKNKEAVLAGEPHKVSGMLLYAKTDELVQPDSEYQMSGNRICVKTLDLNRDFAEISEQLNAIAEHYLLKPVEIQKASLSAASEATEQDGTLYYRRKAFYARGRVVDGGFVVLMGSRISPVIHKSMPKNVVKLRAEYVNLIGDDYELTDNIFFETPTAAASFVCGAIENGKEVWRNEAEQSIAR